MAVVVGRVVDAVDVAGRREAADVADVVVALADQVEVGVEESSCSMPWMTPNTHQVRWSWMRVIWPGRQTSAMTENEPSGSTWSVWLR